MHVNKLMLLAAFLFVLVSGCGTANKQGAISTGEVARVGDTACFQCHGGRNFDTVTGEDKTVQYQRSSPHNTADLGCEACHGGGAQHNGVGPIPFPSPDIARCQTCHDGKTAPITSAQNYANSQHTNLAHLGGACIRCHTNEGGLLSDMAGVTGPNTTPASGAYAGQSFYNRNIGKISWPYAYTAINCQTCHEHGAGMRSVFAIYSTVSGRDTGKTVWNPSKAAAAAPVGDRQADNKNNQFNLCTSCHNMYDYSGTNVVYSGTSASGTLPFYNAGTTHPWYRLIAGNHKEKGMTKVMLPFANMTTLGTGANAFTNTAITGYVIRKVAPSGAATAADPNKTYYKDPYYNGPCFDCHGHEAKTAGAQNPGGSTAASTIHTQWARSAHAGMLLTAKILNNGATAADPTDKVMQAYTDDSFMGGTSAWSHYNWDATLKTDGTDARGSCQMCHTATGFSNYIADPSTYDYTRNDFSHLVNWKQNNTPTTANAPISGGSTRQNEMLYCWGCHKSAGTGVLRATGSATLSFTDANNQPIVIQNLGNSAVCVVCHGGRGSVGALAASDTRSTRFQGHHAPTAGIMFSAQTHIAYEYAGQNYANNAFKHSSINSTTDGPCASCHMAAKNHTFDSISSAGGKVQKIYAQSVCDSCHGSLATTTLDTDKAGFGEATTILNNYVANTAGFANYLNLAITGNNYSDTNAVPNDAYGAYQNGKINGDEPCAYVHNPTYTRRIIFDSIDWMDNGALNGTISFDATAFPNAAAWFGKSGASGVTTFSRP